MAPPFHAEQIGSLLRPAELAETRKNLSSNLAHSRIPQEAKTSYEKLERQCIADAVHEQLTRKIRPITDGEYGRTLFYDGLFEKTPGFAVRNIQWDQLRTSFPTTKGYLKLQYSKRTVVIATAKIKYGGSAYMSEWLYLRSLIPMENWTECKLTMPSPTWIHMQMKPGTAYDPESGYTSDAAYFADLAEVFRRELRTLHEAGLHNVQIDDPQLTYFCDEEFLAGCRADGQDPDELLDMYIKAHDDCLKDKPESMHVGVHLCRGNAPQGMYFSSGSYENIAKKLFNELAYDTFYLEYDTERAGNFEPLRFLPPSKNVVLGVVTTKTAEMEDLWILKERVEEAVSTIAKGQGTSREEVMKSVGVSPQCGFSSSSHGGGVGMDKEKMWEKLELVRDLAKKIWGNEV
ncbi:UROD/MetE-like protein [Viridothelium virens]|uniref:UROD/MetE-like protein n=1 Tax=Viridothelium virens TaxID=1048519 RepID=A0A6A6H1K2_VIRVR|nr:UROD/MetE-like protein [Viridothelium virens]